MQADNADYKINSECERAMLNYPPFKSPHEGFAIILEEMDELWTEIKKRKNGNPNSDAIKKEAVQLAAMCKRFLLDVC